MPNMVQQALECFKGPCFEDGTLLAYIVLAITNLYGAGLFAWWWWKVGRPSSTFVIIMFVFLGAFVENAVGSWSRIAYWMYGRDVWEQIIIQSTFWPFRKLLTNGALIWLAVQMSIRYFRRSEGIGEQRREGDE